MRQLSFWCVLFAFCLAESWGLKCMDDSNRAVDWFVLYKFPKLENHNEDGNGYLFLSSETVANGWKLSNKSITQKDTPLAYTLDPYYKNNQSQYWMMYNDQLPDDTSSTQRAHAKGVIGGDSVGGFWMIHSIPHFPNSLPGSYSYPRSGLLNGQIVLCVSAIARILDTLGRGPLLAALPRYYESRDRSEVANKYGHLIIAAEKKRADGQIKALYRFESVRSTKFLLFTKSKQFAGDIYSWVAEKLDLDLQVQSWRNGNGLPLDSICEPHKVLNIDKLQYTNIHFPSSKDHSKWAVALEETKPWVCIGDINRMVSQEKRAGNIICTLNADLWKHFNGLVEAVQRCPRRPGS